MSDHIITNRRIAKSVTVAPNHELELSAYHAPNRKRYRVTLTRQTVRDGIVEYFPMHDVRFIADVPTGRYSAKALTALFDRYVSQLEDADNLAWARPGTEA